MSRADTIPQQADGDAGLVRATSFSRGLRRHPLWAAFGAAAGLVLGLAASVVVSPSYSATATVLVGKGITAIGSSGGAISTTTTQTAAGVAASGVVANAAVQTISPRTTVRAALKNLTVGTPTDSGTITLTYRAAHAAAAAAGAQAFADAYVAYEQATDQATLSTALRSVNQQLARATAGTAAVAPLQTQRAALLAATVDPGSVISPAQVPEAAAGLARWIYLVAGLLIGLLAGWSLAVLRDRGDDRIRDRADVEALGIPVLGQLGARNRGSAEVTARLAMAVADAGARTLLVSEWNGSAGGAERIMALLQLADPRVRALEQNPTLAGNLLAGSDGVRTLLLQHTAADSLLVMKSGPISRDPDALLPAAAADGVVVVARPGRARAGELARAAADLDRTGGRLLGLVLVTAT